MWFVHQLAILSLAKKDCQTVPRIYAPQRAEKMRSDYQEPQLLFHDMVVYC